MLTKHLTSKRMHPRQVDILTEQTEKEEDNMSGGQLRVFEKYLCEGEVLRACI